MNIQPLNRDAYQLFHDGSLALARAERNGIRVDLDYCNKMQSHLARQIARLEAQLQDSEIMRVGKKTFGFKFNIDSDDQLAKVLFEKMGCNSTIKTSSGKPSTSAEALEVLAVQYPEVNDLVRKRKLTKAKDTYLENYLREQVNGVIHTNFNLHLARSFRPSTDSPNLANVPSRDPEIKKIVRRGIKARPGRKIVSIDFKGVEVSIAYDYHKDPDMETYLRDKRNDMHRDMAMRLYLLEQPQITKPIRHSGKNEFVFPQFYGDWWKSCAQQLWLSAHQHVLPDGTKLTDHLASKNIHDLEDFERHVESVERWMWDEKWYVYSQWKKDWWEAYLRRGYFDSLTGFRYSGIMDRKQACNYPIQGSAFHAMLQCIIWMDEDSRKEGWDSFVCNQIYDDLMLDVHPDEEEMVIARARKYMTERLPEHWPWILVPLEIEVEAAGVDETWYDKKEVV